MEYALRVIFFVIIIIIFIRTFLKKSEEKKRIKEYLNQSTDIFEAKSEDMSYEVRPFIFQKKFIYTLDDDALIKRSKKKIKMQMTYDEIDSINIGSYLIGTYSDFAKALRCEIKSKKKGKIAIASVTTPAVAEFKDQIGDFSRFVMTLHKKLELRFNEVHFTRGTLYQINQTFYIIYVVALILFFMVEAIYRRLNMTRSILGILAIGAIIAGIAALIHLLKKSQVYHPENGEYPYDIDRIAALKTEKLTEKNGQIQK